MTLELGTAVAAGVDAMAILADGAVIFYLFVGVIVGGLVGLLPGLGGAAAVALLIPFVIALPAGQAFALLAGVMAVTATTGDVTSILVGIPGEATSAATVVDGHPMTLRGQSGRALGISLGSSLAGAVVGACALVVCIALASPVLARIGSPELFMLALLAVVCAVPLTAASRGKGLAAGALGLALATVGLDPSTATPRFTFGQLTLWDGVGLVPVTLGLFAIPELVTLAGRRKGVTALSPSHGVWRGIRDVKERWIVVLRSSAIGAGIGLLPGMGATAAQWFAYADAGRRSAVPAEFGRGAIDGVIAPSAANNATLGGALVPTLALGLPGSLTTGLLLTVLILKGYVPGAQMLTPEAQGGHLTFVFSLAWMIVIANLVAIALVLAASPFLCRVAQARPSVLVPVLLVVTFVGAFAERHTMSDLLTMTAAGALGIALTVYEWPRAPLLIGLVLGRLAEMRLFVAIDAYGMSWLARPGVLLIAAAIAVTATHRSWKAWTQRGRASAPASGGRCAASRRGETAMIAILILLAGAGLAATTVLGERAALFPRLALGSAVVLLISVWLRGATPAAGLSAPAVIERQISMRTLSWVPIFLLAIATLGFTWGGPTAILIYLAAHREPASICAAVALAAYLAIEGIMVRLLHVPFPAGLVFS